MAGIEKEHLAKVAELNSILSEKDAINNQLDADLTSEKERKERLEIERTELRKKYEDEKSSWSEIRQKMEVKIVSQQGQFKERIPFDPFGQEQMKILNAVKSDGRTRDKQIEIV